LVSSYSNASIDGGRVAGSRASARMMTFSTTSGRSARSSCGGTGSSVALRVRISMKFSPS
jgi:hypothetical protein